MSRCPGQDTQTWGMDAIFDMDCPKCAQPVEFFKDEMKRRCRNCNEVVFNERMNLGCAKWCPSAASCIGPDSLKDLEITEQRKQRREDFRVLLEFVEEGDEAVTDLFKELFSAYPKEDALFDTNRLATVQSSDEALFERATTAFRLYREEKAAQGEREKLSRARTEELLKHDQRLKLPERP